MRSSLCHSCCAVWIAGVAVAQGASSSTAVVTDTYSTLASATQTASGSSGFTTTAGFSLEDYWNIFVGPISTAAINTTVSATPVPSSSLIPPPGLYYPSYPTGQEVPLQTRNESWSFPSDFWWGVSSASYQVEGAAKDEGKGPSIWDVFAHRVNGYITTNETGDVSDNEYYLYKEDIARIAAMGVKVYSFSISWARVFPFGAGEVNEQGLAHYDDLIDTCIEYGIQPSVTLYHWDLPLFLQNKYGGWLSPDIVDDYVAYARVLFERWGDKVPYWYTFNEPIVFCGFYPLPYNYFLSTDIPDVQQPYWCGHHVLQAHARAYRLFKEDLNLTGAVSLKHNGGYKIPLTNSTADAEATQRAWDFNEGWYANPLFIDGDYPRHLKAYVSTFLPAFTADEKAALNGSADFFAHDAYTSNFVMAPDTGIAACVANASNELYPGCYNSTYTYSRAAGGWNVGPAADPQAPWLHKATDWVPAFLRYIQDTWKPSGGIAVSEFGFGEPFEQQKTILADILFDPIRSSYYRDYMQAILMALADGVDVIGCLAWSLIDNLEWTTGYNVKFGLQYVNFTTQERFYKASFFEYVNAFKVYQET
ncbi:Glycoside hydrolase family 1 [Neofusicoccum parvum]|nr:Glycoside hydrolase family 1 [Neofusicoccum parvum]